MEGSISTSSYSFAGFSSSWSPKMGIKVLFILLVRNLDNLVGATATWFVKLATSLPMDKGMFRMLPPSFTVLFPRSVADFNVLFNVFALSLPISPALFKTFCAPFVELFPRPDNSPKLSLATVCTFFVWSLISLPNKLNVPLPNFTTSVTVFTTPAPLLFASSFTVTTKCLDESTIDVGSESAESLLWPSSSSSW